MDNNEDVPSSLKSSSVQIPSSIPRAACRSPAGCLCVVLPGSCVYGGVVTALEVLYVDLPGLVSGQQCGSGLRGKPGALSTASWVS